MNIKHLKEARESIGLNQKEFAQQLGMSQQRYQHYESGKRQPDNHTLALIAQELNVTTDYLLGKSGSPAPTGSDDEVWALRQEMAQRPEMKTLFDLAKTADKDTLNLASEMIKRMRKESGC